MSWRKSASSLPLVAVIGFGLVGCGDGGPQAPAAQAPLPPALQAGNVIVVNDAAALASRVTHVAEPLSIEPRPDSKAIDSGVQLTLVGSVRPPEVDGTVVQANDIDISGQTAVIAYNVAGDVFAGAVQVVDFSTPRRPVVVSEVLYRDADVDAVALLGTHLYVGLASDDPTLASPALLEELSFTSGRLEQTGSWLDLPSWACTDLAVHDENDVVAGVGARDGGVAYVQSSGGMQQLAFAPQFDVRGVAIDIDAVVGVGGGAARLVRHGLPALNVESDLPVEGYSNDAAKGTLEIYSHRCYLGAGDGGMQVRGADGGLLDATTCATLTKSGELAVVNAVSCQNHLAFVAAGPQGVQVVRLGKYRCDGREAEETEGLQLLGQLLLEPGASCNMVKAKNDILVVAAGAGGVKLVSMQFTN